MKRSVMLCLLVLLWHHWCYCWCFITSRVPARFPPWLCWQAALIPPTSLPTAHLSHLGPTASLVLQWVTLPLQATEGWCVLCMPNVWICCKNFSELALFLLYPSYCNALLLGWSCSWWMDFSVLEQLVSMCKEENHCFQEQNTVPGVMSCSWCTEGLQPCSVWVGSVCMSSRWAEHGASSAGFFGHMSPVLCALRAFSAGHSKRLSGSLTWQGQPLLCIVFPKQSLAAFPPFPCLKSIKPPLVLLSHLSTGTPPVLSGRIF